MEPGGFSWPWEALHYEMLAWYDHWLKGRETGVMDGSPILYQMPGIDGWREAAGWPPPEATLTPFALRSDGVLGRAETGPGHRDYLYVAAGSRGPTNANPQDLPDRLIWETAPFADAIEFAGNIELRLEARITALDTGWIAVLYDVPPEGEPEASTAGWLRASLSATNPAKSCLGALVLDCRAPVTIIPGQPMTYRIPVVPNARHMPAGHALRLVIASADRTSRQFITLVVEML